MDFPGGPVVKDSTLPKQGAWVQSLVGELVQPLLRELRSCMTHGVVKKKKRKPKHRGVSHPNHRASMSPEPMLLSIHIITTHSHLLVPNYLVYYSNALRNLIPSQAVRE